MCLNEQLIIIMEASLWQISARRCQCEFKTQVMKIFWKTTLSGLTKQRGVCVCVSRKKPVRLLLTNSLSAKSWSRMWSKCSARGRHLVPKSRRPGQGRPRQAGAHVRGLQRGNCTQPLSIDPSQMHRSLQRPERCTALVLRSLGERWKSPNPVSADAYSQKQTGAALIASPSTTQLKGERSKKRAKWSRRRRKQKTLL